MTTTTTTTTNNNNKYINMQTDKIYNKHEAAMIQYSRVNTVTI